MWTVSQWKKEKLDIKMDSETTSSMCPWSLSFQNVIDNAFKYWFNRSIYGCYWYFLQKSCPTLPLNPSPTGHWGGDHPRPRKLKVLPTQIHEDGIHFKSNVKLWRLFRSIVLPKKKKKRERETALACGVLFSQSPFFLPGIHTALWASIWLQGED